MAHGPNNEASGEAAQPFDGITVIEFGQFAAVPFCSQVLADGGARVIKVEPLDGEANRHLGPIVPGESRHFLARNRGKHSLPIDLRHPDARPILDALLAAADVVLTNLRPGLAEELGLDYAAISQRYPRVILGNVTPFGAKGADARLPGMDMVVQARSGLMASNGRLRDGIPAASDTPISDYMAAMILAFGVATALYRRTQTGRGSEVEVTLLAAALALQAEGLFRVEEREGAEQHALLEWLADARHSAMPYGEQAAVVAGARLPTLSNIFYRVFATRDGAIAIACPSRGLRQRLLETTGLGDHDLENPPEGMPIMEWAKLLQQRIEAVLLSGSTEEWKARFDAAGIPASRVYFPVEMLDDPQVLANGLMYDLPHPILGPVRVLGPVLRFNNDAFRPGPPTPPLGSEATTILHDLGFSPTGIARLSHVIGAPPLTP